MQTCLYNVYSLTPHFYIVKLGLQEYSFFLIFAEAVQRVPTINVLSKNKKNITFFHLKIIIFTAVKIAVYYIGVFS